MCVQPLLVAAYACRSSRCSTCTGHVCLELGLPAIYEALNAHFMGCDAFEDGDLLVTFPGCKDPAACNPLFNLAVAYANGSFSPWEDNMRTAASIRLFGPPDLAAELYRASRGL
ncbi:unnamed protein product [Effrenium voratum]|nr:unnamed protein product [Effrenium voratum]CAJ1443451.1 unnamed protein product [Effrenium voratum]